MALEQAFLRSLRWLTVGLLPTPVLLLLPQLSETSRLTWSTVHLAAIVLVGFAATVDLRHFVDQPMFGDITGTRMRRFAGAAAVVALVTGVVALITLASSAALRLEPSHQFLQLLSTLDIAWSVAALYYGIRWLRGETAGRVAGAVLTAICIWSIWNYLRIVGFTPDGGWLVDGRALLRWVLPFDTMAAIAALGSLIWAVRQPTEQRKPQS